MSSFRLMQLVFATGVIFSVCSSAHAITLGQVDDFQGGTTQGWVDGGPSSVPPVNLPDAGPAGVGDNALEIATTGSGGGPGSRLVGLNSSQWVGDYLTAGVTSISIDLSSPNNVSLDVRLAFEGAGGNFVTPAVVVPAGGVWTSFSFSVDPGSLVAAPFAGGSPAGTDASMTLGAVSRFRLLHNSAVSIKGAVVSSGGSPFAASLFADNITAVPEPTTWMLFSLGTFFASSRRGRRG